MVRAALQRRLLAAGLTRARRAARRSGYSGVAYYNGWLQSPGAATTATKWVSTCTSVDTATDGYTLDVNGVPVEGTLANMARALAQQWQRQSKRSSGSGSANAS